MKRTIAIFLLLALLLAGCVRKTGGTENDPDKPEKEDPTLSEWFSSWFGGTENDPEKKEEDGPKLPDWLSSWFGGQDEEEAPLFPDGTVPAGMRYLDLAVSQNAIFWCSDGAVFRLDPPPEADMKRTGSAILALLLLFAGCGKTPPAEEPPALETGIAAENGIFYASSENFYLYRQDEELMKTDGAKHNWKVYLDAMRYFTLRPAYVGDWISFADEEQEKYLNDEQDLDYTVRRILERAKMVMEG